MPLIVAIPTNPLGDTADCKLVKTRQLRDLALSDVAWKLGLDYDEPALQYHIQQKRL
nr:hypothetical protein [Nostoc sp. EkiNYC01]